MRPRNENRTERKEKQTVTRGIQKHMGLEGEKKSKCCNLQGESNGETKCEGRERLAKARKMLSLCTDC
eukprot:6207756-Pleurochrysis_carterae.AAC.2